MEQSDINSLIKELKSTGSSPIETIKILVERKNLEFGKARDLVFDSPEWSGIREASETFTQQFLDIASEEADEVIEENGRIVSIKFDLTKDKFKAE
ncbi:MAG: hypothetical protein JXR03_08710 [Cyclobacteriaceae bacterium]